MRSPYSCRYLREYLQFSHETTSQRCIVDPPRVWRHRRRCGGGCQSSSCAGSGANTGFGRDSRCERATRYSKRGSTQLTSRGRTSVGADSRRTRSSHRGSAAHGRPYRGIHPRAGGHRSGERHSGEGGRMAQRLEFLRRNPRESDSAGVGGEIGGSARVAGGACQRGLRARRSKFAGDRTGARRFVRGEAGDRQRGKRWPSWARWRLPPSCSSPL